MDLWKFDLINNSLWIVQLWTKKFTNFVFQVKIFWSSESETSCWSSLESKWNVIFIPVGIPIFETKNKQRNKISAQSIFDKFPVLIQIQLTLEIYFTNVESWLLLDVNSFEVFFCEISIILNSKRREYLIIYNMTICKWRRHRNEELRWATNDLPLVIRLLPSKMKTWMNVKA